jgi:carboxymethylenebutenolidase
MPSTSVTIHATEGGTFACYLATPACGEQAPAVVLACSIDGVDGDLCQIADEFAAAGYVAVAPDLFWRTIPGPLQSGDPRTFERAQPRLDTIRTNEGDLVDTLAYLRTLPQYNGHAAVMGFCYGGPFAILGPKRLGYDAGIACHGSQMLDYLGELDGVTQPVCLVWGDQDHRAPPPVLDAYRAAAARMTNVEVHIFPGIQHGFMMPSDRVAFDAKTRDFAMQRAFLILDGLRGAAVRHRAGLTHDI